MTNHPNFQKTNFLHKSQDGQSGDVAGGYVVSS